MKFTNQQFQKAMSLIQATNNMLCTTIDDTSFEGQLLMAKMKPLLEDVNYIKFTNKYTHYTDYSNEMFENMCGLLKYMHAYMTSSYNSDMRLLKHIVIWDVPIWDGVIHDGHDLYNELSFFLPTIE